MLAEKQIDKLKKHTDCSGERPVFLANFKSEMTQKEIKLIYTVRKVLHDELMYKYLLSICVDEPSVHEHTNATACVSSIRSGLISI